MASKYITVRGARVHNLKNVDLKIPRDKLVIFTGLSGSGKSSLAFDTIYAEGHRRFVESLSSYARQFLGQLDKPDIDSIEGLSPAISIDQKTTSRNPRSTVGTVTEIYDYLRLLYARCGIPHCPVCGREIVQQTTDQIIDRIMSLPERTRFMILAPVVRAKKGMHEKVIEDSKRSGFVRLRIDGSMYDLGEEIKLDKNKKHDIDVVVDRLILKPSIRDRLGDSVETALGLAGGNITVSIIGENGEEGEELSFSQNYACEEHGISVTALEPRMFSFNNPLGACPDCLGIGERHVISFDRIVPDNHSRFARECFAATASRVLMTIPGWDRFSRQSVQSTDLRLICRFVSIRMRLIMLWHTAREMSCITLREALTESSEIRTLNLPASSEWFSSVTIRLRMNIMNSL